MVKDVATKFFNPAQKRAELTRKENLEIIDILQKRASVIVSATFGHLQDSSFKPIALKPCPIWITPY